jgi:hypothetical protein
MKEESGERGYEKKVKWRKGGKEVGRNWSRKESKAETENEGKKD